MCGQRFANVKKDTCTTVVIVIKIKEVLTWVISEQVAQQSCVCPVEHVLNTHTVRDPFAEALPNVLGQEVSVGVPLAVRHQEQHPHESHIGCITNKHLTLASYSGLYCFICCYVSKCVSYSESL